jgi:translation initiation factor IF-1
VHNRRVVVLFASLALVGGCTRTKTLDANGLEEMLRAKIEQQLGTQGFSVDCPDDEPAKAGATFQCSATSAAGKTLTIEVTQTDDQGNVTWKATNAG